MPNLPVGARVNISPSALARSEPVAVARRWTACAKANDHRSGKTSKQSIWDAFGSTDARVGPSRTFPSAKTVPRLQICARAP